MLRSVSLAVRRFQSSKKEKKVLETFNAWKAEVSNCNSVNSFKKLLIIRLDDIGDYIVFRNFLGAYKLSKKWKDHAITLLANNAWKNLYEHFDLNTVDKVIWVDKKCYFNDAGYRKNLWQQLCAEGFETVICPSKTRPLLLDDICALATAAREKIGAPNTFSYNKWNLVSDVLYNKLFGLKENYIHEFLFNKLFTEWCCDVSLNNTKPLFENIIPANENYLIFFVGANSGSRRWTIKRWIELIKLINKNYNCKILISGGKDDVKRAEQIVEQVHNAENIAGKYSLTETINKIASSKLVISNNTMAAHAAVASNKPVIIVTSGDNYFRFTEYGFLKAKNIITIYPKIFLKHFKKYSTALIQYDAVSADIATIQAKEVFAAFKSLID